MNTPGLSEEIGLIQKLARELGLPASEITGEWIDTFASDYRLLWDNGVRNMEDMEVALYGPEEVQSNYSALVSKLILCK